IVVFSAASLQNGTLPHLVLVLGLPSRVARLCTQPRRQLIPLRTDAPRALAFVGTGVHGLGSLPCGHGRLLERDLVGKSVVAGEPRGLLLRRPLLALLRATLAGVRSLAQQRHVLRHDFHGRALAAVPRVVGPHAQLAGYANRRALVQVQLPQRLGALAEYLHANPVGALVVAIAVAHAYAGVPDGGAVVRVLHLRLVAEAAGEGIAVEVAHFVSSAH